MAKVSKNDLMFLPLGGANEIGMNVNLYHYKGKWLMIDLGAGFADEAFPGVSMIAPELSFIKENIDDFLGIVLTHAHEDHLGSVGYLWNELQCPIYATELTAKVAEYKLSQNKLNKDFKVNVVEKGGSFSVGPFDINFIQLTHSIPEMNAVVLNTDHGKIVHTGDWKFDPDPVIGSPSDFEALKALGNGDVLAMVCDSTNIFTEEHSGSEGGLQDSMAELIAAQDGLVVVTAFASNVARIKTIAKAAKAAGRKVAITGLSFIKMEGFARDCGYLDEISEFLTDKEIKNHPRNKLVVMATGSQGQWNAAAAKIINDEHQTIRLVPNDSFIFSSKVIPGNLKDISKLHNRLAEKRIKLFTEKDHNIHVSGHPSRCELKEMYEMVKPKIAVPVHGEQVHIKEHAKLAREIGIENVLEIQNGEMVRLAPNEPKSIRHVETGYYAVDGKLLQREDGDVMKTRRRLKKDGIIFTTIIIQKNGKLPVMPSISTPGVLDEEEYADFIAGIEKQIAKMINSLENKYDEDIYKSSRKIIKREVHKLTGKRPLLEIQIVRI